MLEKAQTTYSTKKCLKDNHSSQKLLSKSQSQAQALKFNKFDIVWAKITGYPWWPAIVTFVPGEKDSSLKEEVVKNKYPWSKLCYNSKAEYRVDFIADQTHAFLKKNFLLKYIQNRDRLYAEGLQFSSRKRRYFQMAINEADQLQQVLEISKTEIDQRNTLEKQKQNSLKQIQNKPKQKNDNCGSSMQDQQNEEQNEIQIPKCTPKTQRFVKAFAKKEKQQSNPSAQNRNKNQGNDFNFPDEPQKKQDNIIFVGPSVQKRKGRSSRIVQAQCNTLFRCENEKSKNAVCSSKIMEQAEQKSSQKNGEIYEQKENSNKVQQQKMTKNEIDGEDKVVSQKQKRINNLISNNQTKSNEALVEDVLKKFKLNTVDEIQADFKRRINDKNRTQAFCPFESKVPMIFRGHNDMMFMKNAYLNISKKKNGKKTNDSKCYPNENPMFSQNLSDINKIKQSQHEKIISQQRRKMIQYSRKYTARKIYSIVLGIIRENSISLSSEQVEMEIKQRCKDISDLIFQQEDDKQIASPRILNQFGKSRKQHTYENVSFFTIFKRKLETTVKFLRLFSLQNWELITKLASFPPELCLQIKSFKKFLQKQCKLTLRNQQKFEDIVKQIDLEHQKTHFAYGPLGVQMQVQNDSANVTNSRNQSVELK